jgi:hypothetical protein
MTAHHPAADLPGAAAGADQPPQDRAYVTLVLRRLSRAVQRATMYPGEHPAVEQAVASLHEHLAPVLARHALSILVARGRLLAAHGPGAPAEHHVPWLSARLHDRGIASLTLQAALDRGGTGGLVRWLAQPGELTPADDLEPIPAVRVTRFDYSRMRFREQPHGADGSVQTEAAFAWGAIANALAADWCVTRLPEGEIPDPDTLAEGIRSTIAAREGTGVADLGARVIAQGSRLAELPDAVRTVVRQKLAAFVSRLAPELRGQLLTVVPSDSPEKLDLLVELVDALPSHDMLEVVQGVDVNGSGAPRQFVTLLRKMVALAASDLHVHAAPEPSGVSRFGLSARTLLPGEGEVRDLLQQLFAHQAAAAGYIPESYQAHIETLADTSARGDRHVVDDLEDPCDGDRISRRVNQVALHLLQADPSSPRGAVFMRRLCDLAPRDLDAGRLAALGEMAAAVERLVAPDAVSLPAETARLATDYLTFCARRPTIDAVLARLERAEEQPDERLLTLLRVGHPELVTGFFDVVVPRTADQG